MKKQRITLEITWDDVEGQVPPPEVWGWPSLLDLRPDETAIVVHASPARTVSTVKAEG